MFLPHQRLCFRFALAGASRSSVRTAGGGHDDYKLPAYHRGHTERDILHMQVGDVHPDSRGWSYRLPQNEDEIPTLEKRGVLLLSASFWFWIFYNFYWDSNLIFGEFRIPDPALFTDAELGIPPDDFD